MGQFSKHFLFSLFICMLCSCGSDSDTNRITDVELPADTQCPGTVAGATPTGNNDVLVWADEFDTEGFPCRQNWDAEIGTGDWGWGNNEKQYYTRSNAYAENGILRITAKKEAYRGSEYTSARIVTRNKFDFTHGRVEVRAKLPAAIGTWPAIWMLGSDYLTNTWPRCGEIDIMEQKGQYKNTVLGTTHWYANGNASYSRNKNLPTSTTEFHVYAMEWTTTQIKMFVDDQQYYTITLTDNMPFDSDFFIILNVAMGGTLGGNIDPNFTESAMEIDYVRVYQ
jgi:beta-glucanase (GH16 family)